MLTSREYPCNGCGAVRKLNELNDAMLCEECDERGEDAEYVIDSDPVAMLREHGTWSI